MKFSVDSVADQKSPKLLPEGTYHAAIVDYEVKRGDELISPESGVHYKETKSGHKWISLKVCITDPRGKREFAGGPAYYKSIFKDVMLSEKVAWLWKGIYTACVPNVNDQTGTFDLNDPVDVHREFYYKPFMAVVEHKKHYNDPEKMIADLKYFNPVPDDQLSYSIDYLNDALKTGSIGSGPRYTDGSNEESVTQGGFDDDGDIPF